MSSEKTVLLLGNGGREHAWAKSIINSGAKLINWAPKINPGIEELASETIREPYNFKVDLEKYDIDLCIIGPEAPLVMGMADWLEEKEIFVFGPNKANARLEGSKAYMREIMNKYQVNGNIDYSVCRSEEDIFDSLESNYEVAVKPDGLTGGKGVRVYGDHFKDRGEVEEYAKYLLEKDGIVLLEELLTGIEFTLQAFVNGTKVIFLPLVKDYKRAFDGDIGPNTGSMGSCSFSDHTLPYLSDEDLDYAKSVVKHVVHAVSMENGTYVGAIYGQFMLTEDGPKIVEFNVRLGDPEAINSLALLDAPLLDLIDQLMDEDKVPEVNFREEATVCVYLVPEGYPSDPESGSIIEFDLEQKDKLRFASVEKVDDGYKTTTSRSIAVLGTGFDLESARKDAYSAIPEELDGLRYRSDIAEEFLDQKSNIK